MSAVMHFLALYLLALLACGLATWAVTRDRLGLAVGLAVVGILLGLAGDALLALCVGRAL